MDWAIHELGEDFEVIFLTEEQQREVAAGRHNFYYDRGIIPPSVEPDGTVVLGLSTTLLFASAEPLTDENFVEYLEYLADRLKLRLIKLLSVAFTQEDKLVEELVESDMINAGYPPAEAWGVVNR